MVVADIYIRRGGDKAEHVVAARHGSQGSGRVFRCDTYSVLMATGVCAADGSATVRRLPVGPRHHQSKRREGGRARKHRRDALTAAYAKKATKKKKETFFFQRKETPAGTRDSVEEKRRQARERGRETKWMCSPGVCQSGESCAEAERASERFRYACQVCAHTKGRERDTHTR